MEVLGLGFAEGTKTPSSPCIRRTITVNHATDLSEVHARTYRRLCRAESAKHHGGEIAKICGRRLLGEPGMVQRIVTQPPVDTITLEVDSDPAGRLRTQMSTTGIAGLSREACDQGSINDTDSDRVFKRRVRILRPNAVAQPQRWAGKTWPRFTDMRSRMHLETASVSGRGLSL